MTLSLLKKLKNNDDVKEHVQEAITKVVDFLSDVFHQTPMSKSASQSNAAKDDVLGADGHFTFTLNDLLKNDPGGAAKDPATQFFFGHTAADQANQAGYLQAHGITKNADGSFTLTSNAIDFQYTVQMGNKGTWSTADVDVTAPVQPPPGLPLGPRAAQELGLRTGQRRQRQRLR